MLSKDEILATVREIVADQLGLETGDIKEGANFSTELGADSLDVVELVMKFEEEFSVEISDEAASKISTVQEAVDYVFDEQPKQIG